MSWNYLVNLSITSYALIKIMIDHDGLYVKNHHWHTPDLILEEESQVKKTLCHACSNHFKGCSRSVQIWCFNYHCWLNTDFGISPWKVTCNMHGPLAWKPSKEAMFVISKCVDGSSCLICCTTEHNNDWC